MVLDNKEYREAVNSIKQDLITSASTLYHRLIDKNDKTFNKAFFNGKYVEDEASVKDSKNCVALCNLNFSVTIADIFYTLWFIYTK